ncbi:alpha-L-fucosidase [Nonomuraea sp. bgisy101]|uniref:alpha-L-fucosidase n=1 Tax=Nonomuraea sp. bgisy101 TaxID=3413784 RepID=UPI003D72E008
MNVGLALLLTLSMATTPSMVTTPDFEPTLESLSQHQAPAWFNDTKLGVFIHWGPTSVPGQDEWYQNSMNTPNSATWKFHREKYGENVNYDDFFKDFQPTRFDPDSWVDLIKDSGAGYFVLTTKHHDGYSLFPSKYSDRNSVVQPPHRDLVGELFAAAKKRAPELKRGAYYSLWEWLNPAETGKQPRNPYTGQEIPYTGYKPVESYPAFMNNQMTELIDTYDPDLIWCDGDWVRNTAYWNLAPTIAHYYNQAKNRDQPKEVLINNRCKLTDAPGEHSGRRQPDYLTPERTKLASIEPFKWETAETIQGWFDIRPPYRQLTSETIVDMFVDIVSKNGNLLLNMSPRVDGTIPEYQQQVLRDLGAWMRTNGEAIHGTTYWNDFEDKTANVPVRFTTRQNALYVTALNWPGRTLELADTLPVRPGTKVSLLGGDGKPLPWRQQNGRLIVDLPASTTLKHAYVFKFDTPGASLIRSGVTAPARIERGKTAPVDIAVTNTGDRQIPLADIQVRTDGPFTFQPDAFREQFLEPGQTRKLSTTMSVAPDAEYGRYQIDTTVHADGLSTHVTTPVEVTRANLALNAPASQSSVAYDGPPNLAVDGNTSGAHSDHSLSHTGLEPQPWWQVDLGAAKSINSVRVWNRDDCCMERLRDYYVLTSDHPLPASLDEALKTPGVHAVHQSAAAGRPTEVPVNANGRYVRVQLAGTDYLVMSEVEVLGER